MFVCTRCVVWFSYCRFYVYHAHFPSPRACFFEWIVGNPIWFVSRLSCKLILGACIFFRHQRKLWLSSAARLLWVTPLDHACLLTFLFFSCYLSVSGSCLQSRAASRHRYVQKNLIVSIPTLRWRERIDQNRDGIVLFCRCAVRASIDLVELVSLVPYQIVHHNVCLT